MTAEEEEATDRLLFHLENQTGFWFGLVVGDDPAPRERLCEAARKWCEEHGRAFYLHAGGPANLPMLPAALADGTQAGVHWIRTDGVGASIESWHARAAEMLMAMNERREAYRSRLEGGILVEGRSSLKRTLREMAPDMFSIRAFIVEPGEPSEEMKRGLPDWRPPDLHKARSTEPEADVPASVWMRVDLYLRLAQECEFEDAERARGAVREAMRLIAQYPAQTDQQMKLKHQVESLRAFVESGPKPS